MYAHNWQDFRRKPQIYNYHNTKCDNWRSARYITKYSEGCRDMENCIYSHGWKEEFYHPMSYKVFPCKEKKCLKGRKAECPFYHDQNERRILPGSSLSQPSMKKHSSFNPNHVNKTVIPEQYNIQGYMNPVCQQYCNYDNQFAYPSYDVQANYPNFSSGYIAQ